MISSWGVAAIPSLQLFSNCVQLILTHGGSPEEEEEEEGEDLGLGGNNVVDNDDLLLMIIMTKKVQTLSTRRLTQKHPSTLAKLSSENIVILIIIEFALTNVLRF